MFHSSQHSPFDSIQPCNIRSAGDDTLAELARLVGDGETLHGGGRPEPQRPVPQRPVEPAARAVDTSRELPEWAKATAQTSPTFNFDLQQRLQEAFGSGTRDNPRNVFDTMAAPEAEAALNVDESFEADLGADLADDLDRALELELSTFEAEIAPLPEVPVHHDVDAELARLLNDRPSVEPVVPVTAQAYVGDATAAQMGVDARYAASDLTDLSQAEPFSPEGAVAPHHASAAMRPIPVQRSGTRRVAYAVVAVALLGGGAALALNVGGDTSGPAPVLMADSGPVKERPAEAGGKVVPDQDQAVYRSVEGNAPTTNAQEKLADASEAPIKVAAAPTEAGAETAAAKPFVLRPRTVRTVTVRPDGSIVNGVQDLESSSAASSETVAAIAPTVAPSAPAVAPQPTAAPTPAAETPPVVVAKVEPAPTPVVAKPVAPQPVAVKPVAVKPAPTPVVAKPAPAPAPVAVAKPAAPTSPYAVQIASQRSLIAAEKSWQTLSKRYGGVLGGQSPDIRSTDIPGKGIYYRVRVPAQTKQAAANLCSQLKNAGGSCFVTR
ncbi:SPOR domain-containing protein [Rhizobiaceae bacterium]|nr:SPOR domain-containing protein [Rhizobiaceae bacterium]